MQSGDQPSNPPTTRRARRDRTGIRLAILMATLLTSSAVGIHAVQAASETPQMATAAGTVPVERGASREMSLLPESAQNIDVRFRVGSDKVANGSGQAVAIVARRVSGLGEYRIRLRPSDANRLTVSVVRRQGNRSVLVSPDRDTGLVQTPGVAVGMRVSVNGASPTIIRVKVWAGNVAEPNRWTLRVRDWSTTLAGAGDSLIRFAVSPASTNAPVTFAYEGLVATGNDDADPGVNPPPTAQPSPTAVPSPTATLSPGPSQTTNPSPTRSPSPSPSPTPSPTPSATPSPTPSPSPTLAATPSPTPTSSTAPASVPPGAFYVSPSGNDASNGSSGTPWRTLQKAADSSAAGATIVVRSGTYSSFVMRRSGTAAAPITFMAYPGETPVIDGHGQVDYTVQLSSVAYVRLIGLTVQGGFAERQAGGGVQVSNSSHVIIRANVLRDNHSFGVRSYNSTYVLIEGNDVYGNAVGVHVGGAGEGTVVRDNMIHENDLMMVNTSDVAGDDAGGEGVALVRTTGAVEVSGNYIWGNRSKSYDYGYDGGAFSIYAASNWTIRDNVTWDNRNVLETGTDSARTQCNNGKFVRNLNYGATSVDVTVGMVLRCASNTTVAYNTFHGIQGWVFAISHFGGSWGGSIDGLRITNNVVSISSGKIYGIETELPSSVVLDNNVLNKTGPGYLATVLGTGTSSLATFQSWTGQETHGMVADPRFRDAAAHDYRLMTDSVAVDRGWQMAGVTDGYAGSGPDCGYRELR
jgi:parallel beta-helix repeat protein